MAVSVPPDKRPVSRGCCLLGGLGLLALVILPWFAVTLAMRQELVWKRGTFVEDRVWLVHEPEAAGLAYSTSRLTAGSPDTSCVQTRVVFFLWQGTSTNSQYCECFRLDATGTPESVGACRIP